MRRFRLLLCCCLLLAASGGTVCANEGYWVLESTQTNKSDAKADFANRNSLIWTVRTNSATHFSGARVEWPTPPDKIRFGDEADLAFQFSVLDRNGSPVFRPEEQNPAHLAGVVEIIAVEDRNDPSQGFTLADYPFRWAAASTSDGVVSRYASQDMHMDEFVPTRVSRLIIRIGASQPAVASGGRLMPDVFVGQTYTYKYVGDEPVYDRKIGPIEAIGEFFSDIPPMVILGPVAVIAGGIVVSRLRKKGKKGGKKGDKGSDPDPADKSLSRYQMVLYKEFGDTLRVGDDPKIVGARIEEITAQGKHIERPDLTEAIQIIEGQNISLLAVGTTGKYRCAKIQVPEPDRQVIPEEGTVTFSFHGPTGLLRNHVTFKIEDNKRIFFCQDNVTYIAGRKKKETIWFYVVGLGKDLTFEVEMKNDKKRTFSFSKVKPDKEGSWSLELTDNLTEEQARETTPGRLDNCYLSITAKEQVKDGERTVTDQLPIHRFYEGLRLEVGHIKAYSVVKGTEGIYQEEEQPTDYEKPLAYAHTRLDLTLFVWDEDRNKIASPVPDKLEVSLTDVPESLEWFGKRDKRIENPVSELGFKIETGSAWKTTRREGILDVPVSTQTYEIIPSAVMVPPNRCKGHIKATARYKDREFDAQQTSMVISMPMRYTGNEGELSDLIRFDEQVKERITYMRNKLLSSVHSPEFAALIYKCDMMLASFDKRFGYYMPEFHLTKSLYLRIMRGEIGPIYTAENAYVWEECDFGDGFNMCMAAFAEREPKTLLGRLMLGICTLGWSETLYYTPKSFLLECQKASYNENSTVLDDFLVGAKFAYFEACQNWAGQKAMGYGMGKLSTTQVGQALAETADLVRKDLKAIEKSLCNSYSAIGYAARFARAGKKVLQWRIDGRLRGKGKLLKGKELLDTSPELQELRKLAQEAQEAAELKVKRFIEACNKADVSPEELKSLVLSIQCDRYAKNYLNSTHVIDKYRYRFTMENTILHADVKKALKQKIAKDFGVHESEITFFEATGNSTRVNAVNCKKIGMDHDYTIRVQGQDLPEELASRYWNDEYCFQATGSKNFSPWDADKLGFQAEQTAVSYDGPESFRSDVGKVVDPKGTAAQQFDNAQLVEDVQIHKVKEPLDHFERCMKEAAEAMDPEWAKAYRKEALSHLREAGRQFPKGMDRTLEEKLKILETNGLTDRLDIEKVEAAYELRGRIDDMLETTVEGDSKALIEFYASFKAEGKDLSKEASEAFSLITEVDELIGIEPAPSIEIFPKEVDLNTTIRRTAQDAMEGEKDLY